MKRFFSIFFVICMFFGVLTGCSCGQKSVSSLKVKDGTLEYVYKQNSEVTFEDLKVIVTYNDGSQSEVGKDNLTISEFSTANVGTYKVTIGYEEKSIQVSLKVTNNADELYDINTVELPSSIVVSNSNKTYVGSDTDAKEREFYVKDDIYVVGDDNPFKFFPNITAVDDNGTYIPITSYTSVSKVYLKDDNNYTLLQGDDLTDMVVISETQSTYDFTDAAVGKIFKLEVRPLYLTDEQLIDIDLYTVSLEFKVVDGYNVTNAVELGILNNDSSEDKYSWWTTKLANAGVTRPSTLNGVVLHNNITVTRNDIPENYFNGNYLINNIDGDTDLYVHLSAPGTTFNFYGNYFTIDASAIPTIDTSVSGEQYSTSSLFKFTANEDLSQANYQSTFTNIENISLIGNGSLTYEDNYRGFGTLIALKTANHTVNLDNAIIKSFYINTYAERNYTTFNINNVKSYDAYQNSLFTWGGREVNITDSEFKRSGGPLMILQHVDPNEHQDSWYPIVNVDDKSILESWVSGDEPWFEHFAQGKAQMIAALSAVFGNNASYINSEGEMNMIALNMSDGYGITGASGVHGKVTINNQTAVDMLPDSQSYATISAVTSALKAQTGEDVPAFMSSEGGVGYYLGTQYGLVGYDVTSGPTLAPSSLYQGNYLGVYYMGMGITLEYFPANAQ